MKAKGLDILDNLIPTMKAMSMMIPDKKVQAGVVSVELFIKSLTTLFGVFGDEKFTPYCRGIIFGASGAATLLDIYEAISPIVANM